MQVRKSVFVVFAPLCSKTIGLCSAKFAQLCKSRTSYNSL
ncbi:hypothetical protein CLOSTMETH_02948 [[Clostridium] methylpentosum DSM 5476]|uniref:Uncharacterized protein n=1 Tax=[Clostridium] methylpentosum DSM 5476 TaxID=537013 RepID=C0EGF5_9FIRM|nr:hypothetical protein CLOSTMETH_02948 [[Clostridium] methylpentosum DSM 5476]